MSWRTYFEYDSTNEIVYVSFVECVLVNPGDVAEWREDMEEYLGRFSHKVDLVMDLSGLEVTFTAGRQFAKVRREVLERYTVSVCGYGGDAMTKMFFVTPGNYFQVHRTPHADSRSGALATVLAERDALRKKGPPQRSSVA